MLGSAVDGQFHFTTKDPLGRGRDHPAVQLSALPAVLAGGGRARERQRRDHQALRADHADDAAVHRGVRCPCRRVSCRSSLAAAPSASSWSSIPTPTWSPLPAVSRPGGASPRAAAAYKRTLIETSGNDPFIVMPSAPIDIAARGAAFGAFLNCGQVCAAAERFYVHDEVYAEFMERLVHYTRQDPRRQRARPSRHGSARLASASSTRYLRILDGANNRRCHGADGRRAPRASVERLVRRADRSRRRRRRTRPS